MMKDPLSLAQETLERYFEQSIGMRRAMGLAIKNVDAYTKARGTKAVDVNSESDTPSIHLVPTAMPSNINFASNCCSLDYNLRVMINTGDVRVDYKLLPICWAIYAAMVAAVDDSSLLDLAWEGQQFIKNFTLSNTQSIISDPTQNLGIVGWVGIVDLTLHMIFPRTLVKQFHTGGA